MGRHLCTSKWANSRYRNTWNIQTGSHNYIRDEARVSSQDNRECEKMRRGPGVTVHPQSFTVLAICVPSLCGTFSFEMWFSSRRTGVCWVGFKVGYRHTARGTKPGEDAAGGAVMAVRVPGFSPFTDLLQKKQTKKKNRVTLNQEGLWLAEIMAILEPRSHVPYFNTWINPLPATNNIMSRIKIKAYIQFNLKQE